MENLDRNFWLESPQQRLHKWKIFRRSLVDVPSKMEKISDVWNIWFFSPDVKITMDPYDTTKWPTVWELLQQGETCKYSKSLGAAYTMYYLNNSLDIDIMRVYDKTNNDIYIAGKIEDKLLMPYSLDVMNFQEECNNISIEETWSVAAVLDSILHRATK